MSTSRDEAVDTLRSVAEGQVRALRTAATLLEKHIEDWPFEERKIWNSFIDVMKEAAIELNRAAVALNRASVKKWRTFAGGLAISVVSGGVGGATGMVVQQTFFEPGTPVAESLDAAVVELEKPTEDYPTSASTPSDDEKIDALAYRLEREYRMVIDPRLREQFGDDEVSEYMWSIAAAAVELDLMPNDLSKLEDFPSLVLLVPRLFGERESRGRGNAAWENMMREFLPRISPDA